MNKKAQKVIEAFPRIESAAVRAVVCYASQNPGFDPADYGFHAGMRQSDVASARSAYASDSRRASAQWRDVVAAARICAYARVTDADILEASRSDRLEVKSTEKHGEFRIHYCAGQYAPTEYRQACARVLEYAARLAHNRTSSALASALFYVNMTMRGDGVVYPDLHKTDGKIYATETDAARDLSEHRHTVAMVAMLESDWHKCFD